MNVLGKSVLGLSLTLSFLLGEKADANHVVLDYCSRTFPTRIKLGLFLSKKKAQAILESIILYACMFL